MFPLSRWHGFWLAGCAAAGFVAALPALRGRPTPPAIRVAQAASKPAAPATVTLADRRAPALYVHVTGQVARPGLYRFPAGARVMDAVTGAGGATALAQLDLLNLAAPLRDGQKLRVPAFGEAAPAEPPVPAAPEPALVRADPPPTATAPPAVATTAKSSAGGKLKNPGDGTITLSTATAADLARLPGVGPATAQKILDYRAAHGGFRNVEELMEVKGIGPKKLARMRPFIVP